MRLLRLRCYDPNAEGGAAGEGGKGAGDDAAALKARVADLEAKLAESARADESRKAAEAKAKADADKARLDAEAADALKRGEHEKLYGAEKAAREAAEAKLADLSARETRRLEALTERNKARIKEIPESHRTLVPPSLDPDALAHYLDVNAALLKGSDVVTSGVRGKGTGSGGADTKGIPAEIVAEADRYGKEPAQWWAWVKTSDPRRAQRLSQTGAN